MATHFNLTLKQNIFKEGNTTEGTWGHFQPCLLRFSWTLWPFFYFKPPLLSSFTPSPPHTIGRVLSGYPHASLPGAAGARGVTLHFAMLCVCLCMCVRLCVCLRHGDSNNTTVHACANCVCPSVYKNAKCVQSVNNVRVCVCVRVCLSLYGSACVNQSWLIHASGLHVGFFKLR